MNFQLFVITLLVALQFTCTPIDGAKNGKSKSTNTTLTATTVADENKPVLADNLSSDSTNNNNNANKNVEKSSYPKKVHSLKKRPTKTTTNAAATQNSKNKRKKVTDVTAAFKDLPADDLEFIKELDKQFQLHGEKIKIKVEHDNSTDAGKQNSKRTIDGELGYGAYSAHNGYQYERPKFMFYPYSQQNIPADAPGYYPPKTDVSIEPSYSYELQSQSYVQAQKHGGAQQPTEVLDVPKHGAHGGGYEEPVIVLRIPGPTKYASHLQTLLQQYLEIRAAQYLRILEETELHKQQQQQQQQHVQQHAQQHAQQHLEQQQHAQQHLEQQQQAHLQQAHLLQQEHILHQQQQQQQQQAHEQQAQLYEQQAQLQHGGAATQAYAEPTLELQPPMHEQHAAQQHVPAVNEEQGYSPEVTYAHQIAPTPQTVVYPEIDNIYQGYKGKLHASPQVTLQQEQHHEQQQHEQVEYGTAQQHDEAAEPPQQQLQHGQQYFIQTAPPAAIQQFYYTPSREQYDGAHGSHHYQNVYFMAIAPQAGYATHGAQAAHAAHAAALQHQPIYVQEEGEQEQELQQQQHQQHQQHQQAQHAQHELAAAAEALVENNPRQTHTKVIYTQNSEKGAADYTGSYTLPSLRPYERHAAASAAAYHQHHQQQQHHQHQQHQQQLQAQLLHEQHQQQHEQLEHQQQYEYVDAPLTHAAAEQEHERAAAITPQPFNYHAHGAKALRRVNRKRGAPAQKTTTAPTTDVQVDEHFQKIREFVRENLGAQMSTAVEFKTTALVKS